MRQHLRIGGGQHDIAVGRLQSRILDDLSRCLLTSECMLSVRHMMRMRTPCKINTAVKCQFCYTMSEVTSPSQLGPHSTTAYVLVIYTLRVEISMEKCMPP